MQHDLDSVSKRLQLELDTVSKRLQVDLDRLSLVHSLRTKEEFPQLSALWKKISVLHSAFDHVFNPQRDDLYLDERERLQHRDKLLEEFADALHQARQFVYEEAIFLPQPIAKVAEGLLWWTDLISAGNDHVTISADRNGLRSAVDEALKQFSAERRQLETLIRQHTKGEPI